MKLTSTDSTKSTKSTEKKFKMASKNLEKLSQNLKIFYTKGFMHLKIENFVRKL